MRVVILYKSISTLYYLQMKQFLFKYVLLFAFIQALVATLGSLYLSEIQGYFVCNLCWYQRVCMYPLVVILAIGIREMHGSIYRYVLPFSVIGWFVSLYHVLIQYSVIPEGNGVCTAVGSCIDRYVNLFGIFTIPSLSFIAFSMINIFMGIYIYQRRTSKD